MKKLISCMAIALFAFVSPSVLRSQETGVPPVASDALPSENGNDINGAAEKASGVYPEDDSPWFDNEGLRRELELDDDQVERLNDAYGSTSKQMRAKEAGSGTNRDEQARSTRLDEYRNRFDDEFNRNTESVFRNPQQRQRFNQLRLQRQGYAAFNNPALQRELNLNDTQIRQLQELNRDWDTQIDDFRNNYASDREGTTGRFNDLNASSRTRFEGIMNDRQRQQYNQMTGNRFDFGADAYLGNRNTNARMNANSRVEGSGIGTPQDNGPQGSGLGTPQDNGPQGSGLGTSQDTGTQGSGLGTSQDTGTQGSGLGTGTDAGSGTGTGSGSGSGTGSGSGSGSGGSGS